MMKQNNKVSVWGAALCLGALCLAGALWGAEGRVEAQARVGDAQAGAVEAAFPDAPRLKVSQWLQGQRTALKGPGRIFLVEVWATWCGPCLQTMPHLVELQKRHGDRLQVVAISDEDAGTVGAFLKRHDWNPISVAVDPEGHTLGALKARFGIPGIPKTFAIQDNKVIWHGHPNELNMVLPAMLAGQWTPQSMRALEDVKKRAGGWVDGLRAGRGLDQAGLLLGESILADAANYPHLLNEVSWALLTEVREDIRPGDLALRMARQANEASGRQNQFILDTYALALFQSGDVQGALRTQRVATRLCREKTPRRCAELEQALRRYEAAAGRKAP